MICKSIQVTLNTQVFLIFDGTFVFLLGNDNTEEFVLSAASSPTVYCNIMDSKIEVKKSSDHTHYMLNIFQVQKLWDNIFYCNYNCSTCLVIFFLYYVFRLYFTLVNYVVREVNALQQYTMQNWFKLTTAMHLCTFFFFSTILLIRSEEFKLYIFVNFEYSFLLNEYEMFLFQIFIFVQILFLLTGKFKNI